MIVLSACLAGKDVKYNGGNNVREDLKRLYEHGQAVLVCPEVMGGLPIPRHCAEIQGDKVINDIGEDVTDAFVKGAELAMETCRKNGCQMAVLKAKSPSCGKGVIYDGTFTHTETEGDGIFVRFLRKEGIPVYTEHEYERMIRGGKDND
ncbi:MAG: DUF523 domain-containing protein [Solobacterium sp.]|nr:DUF523 domain-containing protein [Solobacterium sp.]